MSVQVSKHMQPCPCQDCRLYLLAVKDARKVLDEEASEADIRAWPTVYRGVWHIFCGVWAGLGAALFAMSVVLGVVAYAGAAHGVCFKRCQEVGADQPMGTDMTAIWTTCAWVAVIAVVWRTYYGVAAWRNREQVAATRAKVVAHARAQVAEHERALAAKQTWRASPEGVAQRKAQLCREAQAAERKAREQRNRAMWAQAKADRLERK